MPRPPIRPAAIGLGLLLLAASMAPAAAPLRFFALGDVPYSDAEAALLPLLLEQAAAQRPAFMVHIGDIKGGGQTCTDARNRIVAQLFRAQPVPVIYTPGDNEWTDCHRERAGGVDPLARLDSLRRMFFADQTVLHNAALGLTVPDPEFPEDAWFIRDRVLFVLLHIVGSGNAWQPRNPVAQAAFKARDKANRQLLDQALAAGERAGVRAVVLAFHANPLFDRPRHAGYLPFKQDLRRLLARFDGPVLLIHGDTHRYRFDHPVTDPATGQPIARVQRLEVPGSPFVGGVQVSVDPDAADVFSVHTLFPNATESWLHH
ncbi:MAG: metallophosphoesterase [Thiohalocapsa sp.]|jgi:hypothetical protein|uniref:metallophosphoesterase n=1 Tax=Thiohalocapsa sp. TaxID=2497641 RepID=UPI0025FFC1D7|nr:metallophosphoesterase [Thiohalocapsa sp.]MCG6941474.1 metallophosphoesterase [Thiohalocapsa sp.]